MGTLRVSFPLVKFRRGEARWHGNPPEAVRQLVSTGLLIAKITWRLAKNRSPHAIELAGLKSIYSQIPNVIEFKN
jgi:hypothetical protein